MKKSLLAWIGALFILTGCLQPPVPSLSDTDMSSQILEEELLTNVYTPEYYNTIIPYVSSETRGLVYSYLANRYDIDEFEIALMRHAQDYFDVNSVFYQEGQYLSRTFVRELLERKLTDEEREEELESNSQFIDYGLNEPAGVMTTINGVEVNPVYVGYILEHDFVVVTEEGQQLDGVSIGIALNPYQTYINEVGYEATTKMNESELIEKGKEIAQLAVEHIRTQDGLESVEIMVGLYVLEEQSSVTPGNMVAKTHVAQHSAVIKEWIDIDEGFYLLPSSEIQALDYQTSEQFESFKEMITDYYPHYYGVIGIAQLINDQIVSLDITLNVQFYSLSEKLSFHQLVSKIIEENFPNHYDINVTIRSSSEIYGVLNRHANETELTLKLTNWE